MFRRGAGKRSVAWIPGLSYFDGASGTDYTVLPFAAVPGLTNIWGVATSMTTDTDLTLHGGEDAVFQRLRGSLLFTSGRRDGGAGNAAFGCCFQVILAQTDTLPGGNVTPFNFCTSTGLGNDDILGRWTVGCSSVADGAAGTGLDAVGPSFAQWLHLDVKARRKLQTDRHLVLWYQTALPAGTIAFDCRARGSLRMLLKRPR